MRKSFSASSPSFIADASRSRFFSGDRPFRSCRTGPMRRGKSAANCSARSTCSGVSARSFCTDSSLSSRARSIIRKKSSNAASSVRMFETRSRALVSCSDAEGSSLRSLRNVW